MPNLYEAVSPSYQLTFVDTIVSELNSFAKLKKGWDFGYGVPISQHIIRRSIKAYNYLKDYFFDYECAPLNNGSIKITFSLLDNFLDVIINNGSYGVIVEKGIGIDYETLLEINNSSLEHIKTLLFNIKTQCFSSGQSIYQGTIAANKGLKTASRTWVEASPSSRSIVQSKNLKQRVLI